MGVEFKTLEEVYDLANLQSFKFENFELFYLYDVRGKQEPRDQKGSFFGLGFVLWGGRI